MQSTKKRLITIILILFSSSLVVSQNIEEEKVKRKDLFNRGIENRTFVPQGQWLVGSTFQYSQHDNSNYQFLIMENWDSRGFNFQASPFFAYFLKDNFAIGGRFTYKRSGMDMDQMDIILDDDLSFSINGAHQISHTFYSTFFIRNYLSLGKSNRFGLFNEVRVSYGYGQSKETVAGSTPQETVGVYSTTNEFNIGVAPGMVAFINDMVALEVSIGVLGFTNKWIQQTENQVEEGSRRTSKANFDIDIFSLNIGLSFYL
ncbi:MULTISPECIES: hypothetical protein [Flammeovirga]|uniref:Outer membrane protein beta-barrel domain-containing protein n=1 Tax=Flammeovirga agarivorans TaxID=2726742 RepID=A0A7X8XVV7_9BACT|nr:MULTISPECIES: hypothetical protein [Flammeovirga]NLR91713.1 hypothetical protein [Flammeovirga agarivorans]